jgi:hypothetical protein
MAERSRRPDRPATPAAEQGRAPADAGDDVAQATPEVKPAPPEQKPEPFIGWTRSSWSGSGHGL